MNHILQPVTTEQTEQPTEAYVAPAVNVLGTVTAVTLGHAGANNADDTQYYSNW
ncbi:hypothetical protein [Streptomyces sp. NPDC058583]|uniref:hypothetical protein n=1 Tax=unclassified Streptomyces TaxID=2593676 RepID=UPI0036490C48